MAQAITLRVADVPLMFDSPHLIKFKWQQRAYPTLARDIDGGQRLTDAVARLAVTTGMRAEHLSEMAVFAHNLWMCDRWERLTDHVPMPPPHVGEVWICDLVLSFSGQHRTVGKAWPVDFVSYARPWTWDVDWPIPPEEPSFAPPPAETLVKKDVFWSAV